MTLFYKEFAKSSHTSIARPHSPASSAAETRPVRSRRKSTPYCILVLDESGSTGRLFQKEGGLKTTRIDGIRLAARRYLEQLRSSNGNSKVGIVGFSQTVRRYSLPSPVGKRFPHLVDALSHLRPRGATNLSAALTTALDELASVNARYGKIVIVTDGAVNRSMHDLPHLLVRAASMQVRIFTIGVGNNGDSEYDRNLLIHIAQSTGGSFFSAHSFENLCKVMRKSC